LELTKSFGVVSDRISATVRVRFGTLAADLIVMDEMSMLTPCVANRVSMTLQSISDQDQCEFEEKPILFARDLRQLLPVISNFAMPVVCRLITCLPYWQKGEALMSSRRKIERLFSISMTMKLAPWPEFSWRKLQIG
jgi:hypothetical protein